MLSASLDSARDVELMTLEYQLGLNVANRYTGLGTTQQFFLFTLIGFRSGGEVTPRPGDLVTCDSSAEYYFVLTGVESLHVGGHNQ